MAMPKSNDASSWQNTLRMWTWSNESTFSLCDHADKFPRGILYGYNRDCAPALCGPGARMLFAESVPFCDLQAHFEGVKASSTLFTQRVTSTSSLRTTLRNR